MNPSILYVVLRGEFALYTDPDNTIHALAPNIPPTPADPGHEYRAGGWPWPGASLPAQIPQGTSLSLQGADPTGTVNIEVNQPLPKIGVKQPNPALAYCQIALPPPVRLIPGIKEDAQFVLGNVHNSGNQPVIPASPAVISILQYEFSGALPRLVDSAGNVFCAAVPTIPGFAVIHIIASGKDREKKPHAQRPSFWQLPFSGPMPISTGLTQAQQSRAHPSWHMPHRA